jgi:branched-chain amino acid transport system permease protein
VAAVYVAYSVTNATGSYWLGFVVALLAGLVLGITVERVVMRFVDHSSPLNGVVVALGLVLIIQGTLGIIYGNEYLPVETPFSRDAFEVGGVALLSRYDLFVIAAVGTVVILLTFLFTRTAIGLRMRAAAFAPDVSRLLGVSVGGMLTLGWALAAAVGSLAGMLVVPTELGVHPTAMDVVFISAFAAAVVGGLDSPIGAVVGGLIVGLLLSYVSGYIDVTVAPMAVLALLVVVLLGKPGGLFSSSKARVA